MLVCRNRNEFVLRVAIRQKAVHMVYRRSYLTTTAYRLICFWMAGLAICSGGCGSFQQFVKVMQRLDHRCCPTGLLGTPQIIGEPIGLGVPGSLVAADCARS